MIAVRKKIRSFKILLFLAHLRVLGGRLFRKEKTPAITRVRWFRVFYFCCWRSFHACGGFASSLLVSRLALDLLVGAVLSRL